MGIVVNIQARKRIEGLVEVYQDCEQNDPHAAQWIVRMLSDAVGGLSVWDTIVCTSHEQVLSIKAALEHAFFLGHTEVFRDLLKIVEKHSTIAHR